MTTMSMMKDDALGQPAKVPRVSGIKEGNEDHFTEVRFVTAVTAGGSVKFLPAV